MDNAWIGIVGTLSGVFAGGGITLFISWRNFHREKAEQRRLVTMQIAAQMRLWLIETVRTFRDQSVFYQPDPNSDPNDPNGYFFPVPSDIPAFPFSTGLERISLLSNKDAQNLFNLIEQRSNAEQRAVVTAWLDDHETAAEVFELLIAEVFLRCIDIYQDLAKQVGWNNEAVTVGELEDMRKRAVPAAKPATQDADSELLAIEIPAPPAPAAPTQPSSDGP